jgi:hypothetical protein
MQLSAVAFCDCIVFQRLLRCGKGVFFHTPYIAQCSIVLRVDVEQHTISEKSSEKSTDKKGKHHFLDNRLSKLN